MEEELKKFRKFISDNDDIYIYTLNCISIHI